MFAQGARRELLTPNSTKTTSKKRASLTTCRFILLVLKTIISCVHMWKKTSKKLTSERRECWYTDRRHVALTESGMWPFSFRDRTSVHSDPWFSFCSSHFGCYDFHSPDWLCGDPRDSRDGRPWGCPQPSSPCPYHLPRPCHGPDVPARFLPLPPEVRKREDDPCRCPRYNLGAKTVKAKASIQVPVWDLRHLPWQPADGRSSFAGNGSQPGGDHCSAKVCSPNIAVLPFLLSLIWVRRV